MGIPDNRRFGGTHAGPAFQRGMILVDGSHHDAANVERAFAARVCLVGEDLAGTKEARFVVAAVRVGLHVAVEGVGSDCAAGETLSGSHVGVFVVAQENVTRFVDVARFDASLQGWESAQIREAEQDR